MKKIAIAVIWSTTFISCKTEPNLKQKATETITQYMIVNFKDSQLDKLEITKIDTITPKKILQEKYLILLDKVRATHDSIDLYQSEMDSHIQMMRLAKGLSPEIYQNHKEDYDRKRAFVRDALDRNSSILASTNKLDTTLLTADSTTFLDYDVKFYYELK